MSENIQRAIAVGSKAVVGRSRTPRICFVGPYGVGKTTAVRTVSQRKVVETEATSAAAAVVGRHLKASTTVGLEYGEWTSPTGQPVAVVGTPGQARFDSVRQSVTPRSAVVVLWLFGDHEERLLDCELWTHFLIEEGVNPERLMIAVSRLADPAEVERFAATATEAAQREIPVSAVDPRNRAEVEKLLDQALTHHEALKVGARK